MKKSRRKSANHKPVPVSVLSKERNAGAAHQDEMLDEALEETFPASDPPSIVISEGKDKSR